MRSELDESPGERILPLAGAYNFRDLGGYRTGDGRVTRWGRLFRSDALHEVTRADLEVLSATGLAVIVDLRTGPELERSGRGLLDAEPMRFVHLSMTDAEGGESVAAAPAEFHAKLAERYLWYLEVGRLSLVEVLTLIADPANQPLVFHCAAGKDRTGVVAALVLDILGVDRDTIVNDYVLTATRMPLIMDRFTRDPFLASRLSSIPPHAFAVEAASIEGFLALVDERYGSSRDWALQAGVPAASIESMARTLLVDPAA
jgi:protein-tyrosine phosphatase